MSNAGSGAVASIVVGDPAGNVTAWSDGKGSFSNTTVVPTKAGTCGTGGIHVAVHIEARDAQGNLTGVYDNPDDRTVTAFAQFIQANLLVTTPTSLSETLNNVQGVNKASSISTGQAMTTPVIVAGTTATASTFADYALGDGTTNTDYKTTSYYCNTATTHALSSNTFTITSTITNGGAPAISYAEVGFAITAATFQFLLLHDAPLTGGPFNVSGGGGTLAVTYTLTFT
jgi:hypothetical protein